MMLPISFIATTVSSVAPRTVSICALISAAALAVCGGESLYFSGDHGEALAGITGSGSLDRRV